MALLAAVLNGDAVTNSDCLGLQVPAAYIERLNLVPDVDKGQLSSLLIFVISPVGKLLSVKLIVVMAYRYLQPTSRGWILYQMWTRPV